MTIKIHDNIEQGTEEWHALRCGILTASEIKNIITPKQLKLSAGHKTHLSELLSQRITQYVEPHYISDDMLRGHMDEIKARELYSEHYLPVTEAGFITNDKWGFTMGYSPDGLVGDDGLIEVKSRRQKFQIETILAHEVPGEYMIQIQSAMMISDRKWCDYISYCGGMHMVTLRVYPDDEMQEAILSAAAEFEDKLQSAYDAYSEIIKSKNLRLIPTEREIVQEMFI